MSESKLPFTARVAGLPSTIPFVGPEAIERRRGVPFEVRVGANESAFGMSPKAAEAVRQSIAHMSWYGDPEGFDLRTAIARLHSVKLDEVCLAGGVDELLGLTVRMLVEPGQPVITSLGAYPTFNYHVSGYGGELVRVPYKDDHIDLQALVDAAHAHQAPLVYLANPDNPMGTWHDADAVRDFIDALPERTVVIIDEAYIEFAPQSALWPISTHDPRVLRMRTFSKAHGMAGARIGYVVAHAEAITGYSKIRNHFGVSRPALAAAQASLEDDAFLQHVVAEVARGREDYYELARQHNLAYVNSATNFVAIDVGGGERARALLAALEARDVFIRMPGVAPMDRCIRVSVGLPDERAIFAERFADALKSV